MDASRYDADARTVLRDGASLFRRSLPRALLLPALAAALQTAAWILLGSLWERSPRSASLLSWTIALLVVSTLLLRSMSELYTLTLAGWQKQQLPLSAALATAVTLRRALPATCISLIVCAAVSLGTLACVLPGAAALMWLSLASVVFVAEEGVGVRDSLSRSSTLVRTAGSGATATALCVLDFAAMTLPAVSAVWMPTLWRVLWLLFVLLGYHLLIHPLVSCARLSLHGLCVDKVRALEEF